jgi:ATP-dependent RNA helicase DDX27
MNTKVDDLIKLSLKRPVRIRISDKHSNSSGKDLEVAPRLEQEFVRIRSGNEGVSREAMLLALLTRTFPTQTIVFFDTKVKAHRMMIVCGLCGIKCAELHGNLTQAQRLEALEQFRKGEVDVLLATDLAARGLDISRVETVINFEMPNQVETYIHRIGRTARAGRAGRSCTLIGEGRRHLMKEIMKDASDREKSSSNENGQNCTQTAVIRSRSIPAAVVGHFVKKIESLEEHIEEVLQAEAVARLDRIAEMEASKAQNIIEHSDEIMSRPQRQWFASEKVKKMTKEAAAEKARLIADKVGTGNHRMTRKKRRAREASEMVDKGDSGVDEDGSESKPALPSIKKLAREHKRELHAKEKVMSNKSIHDADMERASKKRKGRTGLDALGDSNLFGEEKITYALKKKKTDNEERPHSAYTFHGYDTSKDGMKKGKKKSHHKFKSKSKYKRR